MMIRELRDHLQLFGADIIFLQEVQGRHSRHAARFEDWPEEPQYEFLADQVWPDFAYGRNAVYDHGHHGNAILSRYPILRAENEDVSHHALERRGMLHCEIELPETSQPLHCICVHLALHERGRRHQVGAIIDRLNREVPGDAPVVVAGDFNDWRNRAGKRLEEDLGLEEACRDHRGKPERTFPSSFPLLRSGVEYFPALEAAIREAQREIFLETYIYAGDATGERITKALCGAARRGAAVHVLVDGFGSRDMPAQFARDLRDAGARLLVFRPEVWRFPLRRDRLRRMHRKIAVADGRIAFVGGINIIDDMDTPRQVPPRYDYAGRIEGPLLGPIPGTPGGL